MVPVDVQEPGNVCLYGGQMLDGGGGQGEPDLSCHFILV